MRNIIYIINPVSGTKSKKDLQLIIEKKTREQKIAFRVISSVTGGDYSFLRPEISEQKITDVVIAGGDGTVSQVVGSLLDCSVNFGIIPCGSGNGLALTAKIPRQPSGAMDVILHGKPAAIDGFYVNDHFACMLCGLGFDARVAHDFAEQQKRGLATYARLVLKNFFAMNKHRFRIQLQDAVIDADAYFISIANSNQFGNNFKIAPRASLSDGLLDIIMVTSQNKMSFVWQTLRQLAGWNKLKAASLAIANKGLIYFQTDRLRISNPSRAPLHIDGDPAETAAELTLTVQRKCFRLLQPA
jgi:diacylglycerol kinase (ATP)